MGVHSPGIKIQEIKMNNCQKILKTKRVVLIIGLLNHLK